MNLAAFVLIISAAALASLADSISTVWAKTQRFDSWWFVALCLVSPLVFMAFGYVTSKLGLAITSAIVNSLIVVFSVVVGLWIFGDWHRVSTIQYIGMALSLAGMTMMLFFPKS